MSYFTQPVPAGKTAIAGVVSEAGGRPVAWASVMITGGPAHRDIAASTDGQGRYRFDSLLPGDYALTVNASGYPLKEGRVTAPAGALARLDFQLG
jgi:hypothetical protein